MNEKVIPYDREKQMISFLMLKNNWRDNGRNGDWWCHQGSRQRGRLLLTRYLDCNGNNINNLM